MGSQTMLLARNLSLKPHNPYPYQQLKLCPPLRRLHDSRVHPNQWPPVPPKFDPTYRHQPPFNTRLRSPSSVLYDSYPSLYYSGCAAHWQNHLPQVSGSHPHHHKSILQCRQWHLRLSKENCSLNDAAGIKIEKPEVDLYFKLELLKVYGRDVATIARKLSQVSQILPVHCPLPGALAFQEAQLHCILSSISCSALLTPLQS